MSDYTKIVDYAAKDALLTGNPAKLVKGTEIGAEFDAIVTAVATKVDETGGAATNLTLTTPILGTPQSGTVTNLTGTASININGTVGATTPAAGAFTTLSATTPLPITSGGTGANSDATARSALSAAASGANSDITSLSAVVNLHGCVLMAKTAGGWGVYNQDGAAVSTGGTTTQGLQEAITYACTNGRPLIVIGAATITCTTAIAVPAAYQTSIYIGPEVTIAFATLGASNLFTFNSLENCEVRVKAVVTQTAGNTGAVFAIKPTSAAPTTGNTTVAASVIELGTAVPASGGIGLLIDLGAGGVNGNDISLQDNNGGTTAIKVTDPGSGVIAFEENKIRYSYLHGFSAYGVQVGTSTTNQANMRRNTWYCGRLAPNGASSIGFSTYEQYGVILGLGANNEEGTLDKGVVFQSGSAGCYAVVSRISGATTTSVSDNGANTVIEDGKQKAGSAAAGFFPTGLLSAQITSASTAADTTETDLQTYTMPANALNSNGRGIRVKAWGTFAANANNKTVKLYFGGTAIVTSTTAGFSGTAWVAEADVYRTGASAQTTTGHFLSGNSEIGCQNGTQTKTDTAAIIVKVTGQNGTANAADIVCSGMTIDMVN